MSEPKEPPKPTKRVTVQSVSQLIPGQKIDLHDWQVISSYPDGTHMMADMTVESIADGVEDDIGYEIKKGAWRITPKLGLQAVHFSDSVYYPTSTSQRLGKIFSTFKKNLHVYDELGLKEKRRAVLLGSAPGVGKSSLINNFAKSIQKEADACILYIDNENIDFEVVQKMFRKAKVEACSFIVLVIEDIGGSDLESRNHNVDSTLLNFLDGQEGMFKIPTLIIGTTNYLDSLQNSLTSRPGRFDVVLEVANMNAAESIQFAEDFIKRELTAPEKKAIQDKNYTAAYIKECIIRHRLDDISLEEAAKELDAQRALGENKSHKEPKRRSRLGFDLDD